MSREDYQSAACAWPCLDRSKFESYSARTRTHAFTAGSDIRAARRCMNSTPRNTISSIDEHGRNWRKDRFVTGRAKR